MVIDSVDQLDKLIEVNDNTKNPFNVLIVDENFIANEKNKIDLILAKNKQKILVIQILSQTHIMNFNGSTIAYDDYIQMPFMMDLLAGKILSNIDRKKYIEYLNNENEKDEMFENAIIDSKIKVLVAEDNKVNQLVISKILDLLQIFHKVVSNGKEVLDEIKCDNYDLLILDIEMPVIDGINTIRHIKENNLVDKETPIIALTAHVLNENKQSFIDHGFNDCLAKPVTIDDVKKLILKYIKTNS